MDDLNFDVEQQEIDEKAEGLLKKKVKIPSGSLCRILMFNVDYPRKIKEEATKFRTKPTIMSGLDCSFAAVAYFDEKGKEHTIIDYSKDIIELPLGESGFKSFQYFRTSPGSLNFHGFAPPANDEEAKLLFNLWLEKCNGIPAGLKKTNAGILFNNFRTVKITPNEKTGKNDVNITVDCYDRTAKKRLTPEEINVEVLPETIHAKIFSMIDPDSFNPF